MTALDHYYLQQEEPVRGCLLALHDIILAHDPNLVAAWKWGMPVFYYKKTMFCYLRFHQKAQLPYLALAEGRQLDHPALLAENRTRFKIMLIDPEKDLPMETIEEILGQAIALYH